MFKNNMLTKFIININILIIIGIVSSLVLIYILFNYLINKLKSDTNICQISMIIICVLLSSIHKLVIDSNNKTLKNIIINKK